MASRYTTNSEIARQNATEHTALQITNEQKRKIFKFRHVRNHTWWL